MKHCGTQTLETGRLLLRRLTVDDCEMMYNNWASDPEVARFVRWNAHRSWSETAELLNEWEKHYPDPAYYQWGITDKRSTVLFGTISIFPPQDLKTGWHLNTERLGSTWEVGFALGRKHADGAEQYPAALFHNAPLVIGGVGVVLVPFVQQFRRFGPGTVGVPPQIPGHFRVTGPVVVHHFTVVDGKPPQHKAAGLQFLGAAMFHLSFLTFWSDIRAQCPGPSATI